MAGAQQDLTFTTLNLGGVVAEKYEDEFNKMLDEVDIALLQEFHNKFAESSLDDRFYKFDGYEAKGPKTNLCILISKNLLSHGGSFNCEAGQQYIDGKKLRYMYGCLRLEETSYFIVNLHIQDENCATMPNLQMLQKELKEKSEECFEDDRTFRWIIGGDFNFINRLEDGAAESSLRWWRHYFIDTLPAKDIYPRSSRQEVKCTRGDRRNDRLYVDKRLLNCITSVRTGDKALKDHRPVYCTMSPIDGTEEAKCHLCEEDREIVRCSTCCLWVCRECASEEEIFSKRREKRDMRSTGWTFNNTATAHRDGEIDGSTEETVTDGPDRLNDTILNVYSCKSCDERRRDSDMKLLYDLFEKLFGEDLMKKFGDLKIGE